MSVCVQYVYVLGNIISLSLAVCLSNMDVLCVYNNACHFVSCLCNLMPPRQPHVLKSSSEMSAMRKCRHGQMKGQKLSVGSVACCWRAIKSSLRHILLIKCPPFDGHRCTHNANNFKVNASVAGE